jgi:sec-independent protein translocase protein TatB
MGNLGIQELVVIAVLALIVLGPEKFPTYAKIALRAYRDLRTYFEDTKRDITREFNPLRKEFDEIKRQRPEDIIDRLTGPAAEEIKNVVNEVDQAVKDASEAPANGKEATPDSEEEAVERVPGTQPASRPSNRTENGDYSD